MREKGIDEEETERRFSRGERIGADPLAPRGRPPLEHTAGDGQRLRRARPPRPMPCNLYRRHCLTAPSRRRATASTRHHPRVMRREPFFFRRSDFRSLFLVRATRRRDFGLFSQTGWLCVGCAGMPTDTPKTHADTAVASCPPLSLFPPGWRSDGSDVTAQRVTRRTETRTHDGPDIYPPDTRPNAFADADTPIQSRPRLVPTARVRSPGRISLFGSPRRRMSPRAAPDRKPDDGRDTWSYRGSKSGDTAANAARFLNSNTLQDSQVRVHRPRRARRRASRVHPRFSS